VRSECRPIRTFSILYEYFQALQFELLNFTLAIAFIEVMRIK
jgi:hypothetical protein